MKIAVAHFRHETVTFLENETTREDFIYPGSPLAGDQLLRSGPASYMGGFVKVAREFSDVNLAGISSPMFPRTGIGSGWVTADAYEWFVSAMLEELRAIVPVDGVYLALHGAMAVRGVARPEADLARRIRAVVGARAHIAATFDPHGNEDEAFAEVADLSFCAKYYPHYDEYLQGTRAARTLVRAIRGDYRAVHATCKVPILSPTISQWTGAPPWSELIQRALEWEARSPDLYVNVFFGFPWGDAADAGMTLQAFANDDPGLAESAVRDLARFAWQRRADLVNAAKPCSIHVGVQKAAELAASRRVVIADHSDRSGSATWLLHEIINQGISHVLLATIADRTLAERLSRLGTKLGELVDITVGGAVAQSDGPPVRVMGRLLRVVREEPPAAHPGNTPWIVIGFGRENLLVVTPFLAQVTDPRVITGHLRVDLTGVHILCLKSRVHFRRGFVDSGFAEDVIVVEPDQPFLGTTRLDALTYQNLRLKDFYPYGPRDFEPRVFLGRRVTEATL